MSIDCFCEHGWRPAMREILIVWSLGTAAGIAIGALLVLERVF